MRKSTLFISATLTVFMLVTLFGVVSAYQGIVTSKQAEPVAEVQPTVEVQPTEQFMSVAPVQAGVVTPEEATTLAMQMIDRSDVYSVESTLYENAPAYLVTFTSGDLVYVSPNGLILAVTKLAPVVVVVPGGNGNNADNNQVSSAGSSGGEHEDYEEHEEHEDD